MKDKLIVDLELMLQCKTQLNEINQMPLEDIRFVRNGKELEINKKNMEDWKFIGLSNTDFITTGFYESGLVRGCSGFNT